MSQGSERAGVPLAVVGSGRGGDCAPTDANYITFFDACSAPALSMLLTDAGHFQFLDEQSALDRAVCTVGNTPDSVIRLASQAVMIAWGQLMIRGQHHEGGDSHVSQAQAAIRLQEFEMQLARLVAEAEPRLDAKPSRDGPAFQLRSKGLVHADQ